MRLWRLVIIACLTPAIGCGSGGASAAQRDIQRNQLELRIYGLPDPSDREYARLLKERLGVAFNRVAGCVVDEHLRRSTDDYDRVMTTEIERRFGAGILDRLESEAQQKPTATRPAA